MSSSTALLKSPLAPSRSLLPGNQLTQFLPCDTRRRVLDFNSPTGNAVSARSLAQGVQESMDV